MIVKNEQAVLARCLHSVKGLVDEIIVVDTGSTDQTREIAARYTQKIYDFAWIDDFSAARNFAFQKAEMEYCIWLDADDVLPADQREGFLILKDRLSAERPDVVMMPYEVAFDGKGNPTFRYYRERIVKNHAGFVWEGAVHEVITPSGKILYSDVTVRHQKEGEGSPGRNLAIYERLLKQGREFSPREQFYYARELMYNGRLEEAQQGFLQFLQQGKGWVENNIDACRQRASCLKKLGRELDALRSLFDSFIYGPPRAETCCDIGAIWMERGSFETAAYWYEQALARPRMDESGAFVQQDCYGYLPSIQLCVCYDRLGQHEKARDLNELAASFKPDDPAVLLNRRYFEELFPNK